MKQQLIQFLDDDLSKLKKEVEAFADDNAFWSISKGITNSPGNLTLHLLGNLNHYIGAKLGKSGYVRDRPLEFSSAPIPRSEILDRIDKTRAVVVDAVKNLSDDDLRSDYPADEGGDTRNVAAELVRILTHFNYHRGQINYYRRLSSK
jgi:hypothetical protein